MEESCTFVVLVYLLLEIDALYLESMPFLETLLLALAL